MEKTKFSVIIPAYNVEKYIEKAIKSVINQKYENYEIIIVDDGSTDKTVEIIEQYVSDKIKIIKQKHLGVSAARNSALREAKGDYIVFLDSDDWLENWLLIYLNKKINKRKQCVTFIGTFKTHIEKGESRNCVSEKFESSMINNKSQGKVLEYLYCKRIIFTVWRFVVNRKLIECNNLYFLENYIHEDEEWVPKLLAVSKKFSLIEEPFYNYRIRKNSIMSNDNYLFKQKCLINISYKLLEYSEKEIDKNNILMFRRSAYKNLFQAYLNIRKYSNPIEPIMDDEKNKTLKNILIFGTSRVGKTTLANLLSKKLKYSVISEDNLISGFEKGLPDTKINHHDRTGNSVRLFEPFLIEYIKSLNSLNQKLRGLNYIIEGSYLSFEKLMNYQKDFVVIVLVSDFKSPEEYFNNMRRYDGVCDWTKKYNDKELYEYATNLHNFNCDLITMLEKNKVKYYSIGNNREKIFNDILQNIDNEIRL